MRCDLLPRWIRCAPLFLLLTASPAAGGTAGATLKETPLKQKPFADAATLASLPAKTAVEVLERQGGWLKVKAKGSEGWVRMLSIRTGGVGQPSAGSEVKGAAALATGRAGKGNIVATSGIRGLSDEELKAAKPNPAEFEKLERNSATDEQARQYARRSRLEVRSVPYLEPPREPAASPGGPPAQGEGRP